MPRPTVLAAAAVLLAAVPLAHAVAQFVVQQQVVIRMRATPVVKPTAWVEKKGPKCVALGDLAGALVARPDAVDLVLANSARVRARLDEDCPSLNFYRGFYIKPTKDGKVCAGRDAIRSRAGRTCEIETFRKLVVKR